MLFVIMRLYNIFHSKETKFSRKNLKVSHHFWIQIDSITKIFIYIMPCNELVHHPGSSPGIGSWFSVILCRISGTEYEWMDGSTSWYLMRNPEETFLLQISHPTFNPNVNSVSSLMITTTLHSLSGMSLRTDSPKCCLAFKKISAFLQCLFWPAFSICKKTWRHGPSHCSNAPWGDAAWGTLLPSLPSTLLGVISFGAVTVLSLAALDMW